jgi:hypothetical protein
MNTSDCAWCLFEKGETPQEQSHGICPCHVRRMLYQRYTRKYLTLPFLSVERCHLCAKGHFLGIFCLCSIWESEELCRIA